MEWVKYVSCGLRLGIEMLCPGLYRSASNMDVANILMALAGVILGAAVSLLLVEVSRFRQTMDQACLLIMNLDEVSFNARNELELQLGYVAHYKAITLQLAIMDQREAKAVIDRIVNECGIHARVAWKEIQQLPADHPTIVTYQGPRWKLLQVQCGFAHNERHVERIEELRACAPDWNALFISAARGVGMAPHRKTKEKVI